MSFDSITNRGEFFSNHYLDAIIGGDLGDLRRTWDEQEKAHKDTARSRLKALSKPFFAARADATEASNDANARRATETLNGHVLRALGLEVDRQVLTLSHTTTDELRAPVAATVETGSGLHLVGMDAGLAEDVDDLFATGAGAQGRLLNPVQKVGEKLDVLDPADAVSALFAVDDPPRWVLVVAGRIVLLAERARWAEGRFLAADLDIALERNDTSAKGEIETIAALFSTDALVPHDGQAIIDELADSSTKHAIGVSKDLREGIRQSIEILANEVIERRLAKNLAVYSGDNRIDPQDLTTQSLRYLYRLLVLLYAESRPELGIVPVDDEVYMAGYSLDRLRELTLTELDTDKARCGTHLDRSLRSLFQLVNEGYHADSVAIGMLFDVEHDDPEASYEDYLQFPGLDAQLFDPTAVPLIDSVTLRNEPLQKILQLLMLSPEGRGKRANRGFISYAQLGINQLGAVYEGLMAYTGFFADTGLYEVAKHGDPSDGTWVLPVEKADEYPEDVFVTREDPLTGAKARVLHPKGSFVFRLSGRDRQRSASYYTPEVLTRCVVKHALAELLGTDNYAPERGSSGITEARQILDLTICEPALGSGAFLNEAINQLSAEYLKRRQAELAETLDPEQYNRELQKVKAHFALHQSYGVDLNATAVELAEVSLWLNCMHPGLKAPWFGMQLRRGNSLIGCRRATWKASQLKDKPWAKTNKDEPPADRPLTEHLADDEIHYFLLPGHGWGAVADRREARELRPSEAKALKDWRTSIINAPSARDAKRLKALASGIERLWAASAERLKLAQRSLRRPIEVWGAGKVSTTDPADRRKIINALEHPDSELSRLRLAMDAWVGLWFWRLDGEVPPPTWKQWLAALEDLIAPETALPGEGQLDLFDDLDLLLEVDEAANADRPLVGDVVVAHPWLVEARTLAHREGAYHWYLEFAPAFAAGGFDLQVGNPPWVRPTWDEKLVLAEVDPAFGLGLETSDERRKRAIERAPATYVREMSAVEALGQYLGSAILFAELVGVQTNLYMSFIVTSLRHACTDGVAGLIHPEGHFSEARGGVFRSVSYRTLRRLFHFVNEAVLFEDVGHTREYGLHVYGSAREPRFLLCSGLHLPSTVDVSLAHDGGGEVPSKKHPNGDWDRRPHARRIVPVDRQVLSDFAPLSGGGANDVLQARLLFPYVRDELPVLESLGRSPRRYELADLRIWTGLREGDSVRAGVLMKETSRPTSWEHVVLQNPHIDVANPVASEPREECRSHHDYDAVDLARIPDSFVPRSNYQPGPDWADAVATVTSALGSAAFKVVHRRRVDPDAERALRAVLMPTHAQHANTMSSVAFESPTETVRLAALLSSVPYEYPLKLSGRGDFTEAQLRTLPWPNSSPFDTALVLRTARLNLVAGGLSSIWERVFSAAMREDQWIDRPDYPARPAIGDVAEQWTSSTPLRGEFARYSALVEIDAMTALILGLDCEALCSMYRTQFAVARKYEAVTLFDASGRKIAGDRYAVGVSQEADDWDMVQGWLKEPDSANLVGYRPPFYRPDREAEMTTAYNEFQRRLETGFYDEVSRGTSA